MSNSAFQKVKVLEGVIPIERYNRRMITGGRRDAMIWRSVRHILFAEYVAYLLLVVLVGMFGLSLRLLGIHATTSSSMVPAVWLALFIVVYRIRYWRF
jgi:hypothetical protein